VDPFEGDLALKNKGDFDLLLFSLCKLLEVLLFVASILFVSKHEDFVLKLCFELFERFDFALSQIPRKISTFFFLLYN
jgi:hypothetical protein